MQSQRIILACYKYKYKYRTRAPLWFLLDFNAIKKFKNYLIRFLISSITYTYSFIHSSIAIWRHSLSILNPPKKSENTKKIVHFVNNFAFKNRTKKLRWIAILWQIVLKDLIFLPKIIKTKTTKTIKKLY